MTSNFDDLPHELLVHVVAPCAAKTAITLQRTSKTMQAAVKTSNLEAQQPELLRLAQFRLYQVREWLHDSATFNIAPQIFGVNTEATGNLWTAHVRRFAGAELQRRLAGDSPYKYIGESLDSEEEERPWPPTLPLEALSLTGPGVVHYKPMGENGGDPEEEGYAFSEARLAFGIELDYNELRHLLYVGRRWYKGEHGMGDKGESESVDVEPDPARGPYYDFTDEEAVEYALENMWDRDLYTGPWLKYHLHDAINDLLIRTGMPNNEPDVYSDVDVHCTGFQDHAGDDIVLGIRLGPFIDASGFDLKSQLGMSFLAGNDNEDFPSGAIQQVSNHLVADLIGWPVDSLQLRAVERELRARMKKVLRALKWPKDSLEWTAERWPQFANQEEFDEARLDSYLHFYVVFDANC